MPNQTTNPALSSALHSFLLFVGQKYSVHTHAAYAQALDLFCRYLAQEHRLHSDRLTVNDLQPEWVMLYLSQLQETRSVETEHLYLRTVLHFYEFAATHYDLPIDLSMLAEKVAEKRRTKSHSLPNLPASAMETMLEFAETFLPPSPSTDSEEREYLRLLRDRAFVLTLADTGLRVSEICNLHRADVDLDACELRLSGLNTLPLTSRSAEAIRQYLTARHKLDTMQTLSSLHQLPVFSRHDKRASKRVLPVSRWTGGNIVEAWAKLALPPLTYQQLLANGQRVTPHSFRHYFVLVTLTQTADLATTRTRARHGDPSTTRRYLRSLNPTASSSQE